MVWEIIHDSVLRKYPKAIVHLRAQHNEKRLSLMLGAGASKDYGVPNWQDLVRYIAKEIDGEKLIEALDERSTLTSKIQVLMTHFQQHNGGGVAIHPFVDLRTKRQWQDLVRKKLYENLLIKDGDVIREFHPYIGAFKDIINDSPMTINYNFDDFVERMFSEINLSAGKPVGEGFESVWDINLQFKSNSAIIYHPNGFLPRNTLEICSDWLVFSDDEYADQLIYSMTGYFSSLSHHLSKNTCLLVGLSLEDSTLKHILRQNARINPGHCLS